jgi:hypothetical protein
VSDDFVDRMEVVEDEEEDAGDCHVNEPAGETRLLETVHPHVSVHRTSWLKLGLLLAVMSAYLRTGQTLMKLRLNINYLLLQHSGQKHTQHKTESKTIR